MPSMGQNLLKHNISVRNKQKQQPNQQPGCNCREGIVTCPLNGLCLTEKLVYHATVESNNMTEHYTGLSENTFKQWHYRHTEQPHLGFEEHQPNLHHSVGGGHKKQKCRLCLKETFFIMTRLQNATLNHKR